MYFCFLRSTGAYVQILSIIFVQDLIPFIAIFSLFLFSFTGAFHFALRWEEFTVDIHNNCSSEMIDNDDNCSYNLTSIELSGLDIFPHLTR